MKGNSKLLILTLALAVIFLAGASREAMAQQPNIGVFDLQKVLNDSKKGQAARKKLESTFKKKQEELKKKEETITKQRNELVKMVESRSGNQEEMRKRDGELQKLMVAYQAELGKANETMRTDEEAALKPLVDKAVKTAGDLGRARGYIAVIEVQQAGVVYAQDSMDLTAEIVKAVDK
ncbi:MAG: OmpH family outer membrane protein [Candidatus Adiutrix sp.]|jgi:outer membrane protein|nr:OmpH family outer membrane protein [Candidatus Adiutrix sp.]